MNHSWVASRDEGAIEVSRLVLSELKSSPLVVHFNLAGKRRKIVSFEVSSQVSTISRIFEGGSYSDWSAWDQSEIADGRNRVQSSDFAPTISATFIFGFSRRGDVTLSTNKWCSNFLRFHKKNRLKKVHSLYPRLETRPSRPDRKTINWLI